MDREPLTATAHSARKIIRLGVPVLISALGICLHGSRTERAHIPFESLGPADYGVLILLSLALAVFWGMIIKPILGIWVLRKSSRPSRQQAVSEPKQLIAAGVG